MVTGSIVFGLLLVVVLLFYKRDLFIKMFSIHLTSQTSRFQQQLEQTGDLVVKRLEEQIVHLEYLLEEANEKIISLEQKIETADKVLDKEYDKKKFADLECLLEKANDKMIFLDQKIELVNSSLTKEHDIRVDIEENVMEVNAMEHVKKEFTDLPIDLYRDMPRKDKRNLIIEMTGLGYDINEIAKATGISKGEIMLLLQLNKENSACIKP